MLRNIIKKLIPIFFILAIFVGGFIIGSPSAEAASCTGVDSNGAPLPDANCLGYCPNTVTGGYDQKTKSSCSNTSRWLPTVSNSQANTTAQQTSENSGDFAKRIGECGTFQGWSDPVMCGLLKIVYFFFVTLPSLLLILVAKFFNFVTALTLSSDMYRSGFIPKIWTVVRDFSNIMFILMLLYAAIQIILNLGHGGGKQIVASVIMVALLVNFSLFFTRIVIDASNITALIFYNKIDTTTTPDQPVGAPGEKDMAGALVSRFNPNAFFGGTFFESLNNDPVIKANGVTLTFKMGLILIYGIILYVLAYAFLIGALSMFGRMLTLMMLLIISPFAFVTKAVPSLGHMDSVGFYSWLKNLIKTSFMAVVFIFIIYITSEILAKNPFSVTQNGPDNITAKLVILFMPAILIILLLLKGVKYAKSASGQFTDMVMKGAGFAGGAAMGIGAMAATGGVGLATFGAKKSGLSSYLDKRVDNKGLGGWASRTLLKAGDYTQKASFDVRKAPGIGTIAKSAGIDLGSSSLIGLGAKDGGYKGRVEEYAKARKKEAELFKTNMSEKEIKDWSAERIAKWEAEKENQRKAVEAKGGTFDEKEYDKNNHKPHAVKNAEELNHERLEAFKDRLGIDGLLGAAMYSSTAGRNMTEKERTEWALNAKRWVGVGLAAVAGGTVGAGLVGGIGGTAMGAGIGAGAAIDYGLKSGAGDKKFGSEVDKESKKLQEIEVKLGKVKKDIAQEQKFVEEIKNGKDRILIPRDGGDIPILAEDLFEKEGDKKGSVNSEKVADLLSDIELQDKMVTGELQTLVLKKSAGTYDLTKDADRESKLRTQFTANNRAKAKLNRLAKSEENISKWEAEKDRL